MLKRYIKAAPREFKALRLNNVCVKLVSSITSSDLTSKLIANLTSHSLSQSLTELLTQ